MLNEVMRLTQGNPANVQPVLLYPELPKTKNEIIFEDRIIEKIKNDLKSVTIRNSPVSLGYKRLEEHDLNIEILSCEKIEIMILKSTKTIAAKSPKEKIFYPIDYKTLGFENDDDMYEFYKNYLKRDFAYAVTFCRCINLKGKYRV